MLFNGLTRAPDQSGRLGPRGRGIAEVQQRLLPMWVESNTATALHGSAGPKGSGGEVGRIGALLVLSLRTSADR
jgi:hypothetical protein